MSKEYKSAIESGAISRLPQDLPCLNEFFKVFLLIKTKK